MEFVHQSFKPPKFIGMTKGKTYIKETREFRFLWTAHFGVLYILGHCHFTPFCMKNFGDLLLRSLSALDMLRVRDTATTDE